MHVARSRPGLRRLQQCRFPLHHTPSRLPGRKPAAAPSPARCPSLFGASITISLCCGPDRGGLRLLGSGTALQLSEDDGPGRSAHTPRLGLPGALGARLPMPQVDCRAPASSPWLCALSQDQLCPLFQSCSCATSPHRLSSPPELILKPSFAPPPAPVCPDLLTAGFLSKQRFQPEAREPR